MNLYSEQGKNLNKNMGARTLVLVSYQGRPVWMLVKAREIAKAEKEVKAILEANGYKGRVKVLLADFT